MLTIRRLACVGYLALTVPAIVHAQSSLAQRYRKVEARIPMRDGVRLFTAIYVPRDTTAPHPILIARTPYSVAPYGADAFPSAIGPSGSPRYAAANFIVVYQDVRGRFYSEGSWTHMTPHKSVKRTSSDVDESTDTYDTIEWLLNNVRPNNGRVGLWGISYPGFYASAGCIDAHPALKACSPQSPIANLAAGDDMFHNGAFLLGHNFRFHTSFGRTPRAPALGPDPTYPAPKVANDAYSFFLNLGPVRAGTSEWLPRETAPLWHTVLDHPSYDAFWRVRDLRPHIRNAAPAVLVVGGQYDAEDLAGTFNTYHAFRTQARTSDVRLVLGPWSHGGWRSGDGTSLGTLRWQTRATPFYIDSVEFPFFAHHLLGAPAPDLPRALVFRAGSDQWDRLEAWPPPRVQLRAFYLQSEGGLTTARPTPAPAHSEYVSDPRTPVPLMEHVTPEGMPKEYTVADQRFASRRPDVLTFQTPPLEADLTISGPLRAILHVATSGTDADFVVKVIDVYPEDAPNWPNDSSGFLVGGYQQLVRGEPFRARYRRGFDRAIPLVANQPDSLAFSLPDVHHTFRRGHRIMVQIQSSWFPLADRNPQRFVPNIFDAAPADFQRATMRIYHDRMRPSRIEVLVTPQ